MVGGPRTLLLVHKLHRVLAVLASVALVGSLSIVTSGVASAANTRLICFGSPGTTGDTLCDPVNVQYNYAQGYTDSSSSTSYGIGSLTNSAVTVGGATAVDVVVTNVGTQTVNHVTIAGGETETNGTFNSLTLPPKGPSLPSGWSYLIGYSLTPGLSNCSITSVLAQNDSISCSIGQLAAGASASFLIVIQAANDTATTYTYTDASGTISWDYWFSTYLNEGTSSTGSNADTFFALGDIAVHPPSCNGASTYTLGSNPVSLPSNLGGALGCATVTAVSNTQPIGGNGAFTRVVVLSLGDSTQCPAGYTCLGQQSNVDVGGGIPVPGGLEWVMDIPVSQIGNHGPKGVIHLGDNFSSDPTDYTVIPFKHQYQCSTSLVTNCWVSVTETTINSSLDWEMVFVTPDNGGGRAYF